MKQSSKTYFWVRKNSNNFFLSATIFFCLLQFFKIFKNLKNREKNLKKNYRLEKCCKIFFLKFKVELILKQKIYIFLAVKPWKNFDEIKENLKKIFLI